MTPLLTLDPLPTLDAAGAEVKWAPALLASLQTATQNAVALTSRLSAEKGANAVACWYQAPGSADALPVDVLEHFVRAPYFVGCYYVRIVVGGATHYHRCTPTEGGDGNARALTANIAAREREALLAELAESRKEAGDLRAENKSLRDERNDGEDANRALKRDMADLAAALAAAEQNQDPLFGEAGIMGLLKMGEEGLKSWAEGGEEGQARGLIELYFVHDARLAGAFSKDVDVMTLIMKRYPEQWDSYVAAFNEVSRVLHHARGAAVGYILQDSATVAALLPAAREAARAEASQRIEEARALVMRHDGRANKAIGSGASGTKRVERTRAKRVTTTTKRKKA